MKASSIAASSSSTGDSPLLHKHEHDAGRDMVASLLSHHCRPNTKITNGNECGATTTSRDLCEVKGQCVVCRCATGSVCVYSTKTAEGASCGATLVTSIGQYAVELSVKGRPKRATHSWAVRNASWAVLMCVVCMLVGHAAGKPAGCACVGAHCRAPDVPCKSEASLRLCHARNRFMHVHWSTT